MPEDADVREILQAERDLYRAMIVQDFAALERILSPDLVYVHPTAVAETKEEYLQGVATGLYEYDDITTRGARVRVLGDVALVDGICDMKVGKGKQPKDRIHLLFVLVWARDGDAWRLEHRHATRMVAG